MDWVGFTTAISNLSPWLVAFVVAFVVFIFKDLITAAIKKKFGKEDGTSKCDLHLIELKKLHELEMTIAVNKNVEKERRIWFIKHIELVEAQMVLIERLADKCKNILMDEFHHFDESTTHKEVRAYDKVLDVALVPIIKKLREWVIKNHLSSRTDFREYVEETTSEVMDAASSSISKNYMSEDFSISALKLKKYSLESGGKEIMENIADTLYELRVVSVKYEKKISEIKEE